MVFEAPIAERDELIDGITYIWVFLSSGAYRRNESTGEVTFLEGYTVEQYERSRARRNRRDNDPDYAQREREALNEIRANQPQPGSLESIALTDENGNILNPSTGLPITSAANSLAFRFEQRLAEVVNNAEGTNIFSFFDFDEVANDPDEYVENTIQPSRGDVEAGYGDQGILNIEIPFRGSINDFNNIIGIRSLSQRENFDDPKSAIKILVSVENIRDPQTSRNKYLVTRFNLSNVKFGNFFIFQGIRYIAKEFQGISYWAEEYEPQTITLNFYAQGVITTEIFDMHSITFTIPQPEG